MMIASPRMPTIIRMTGRVSPPNWALAMREKSAGSPVMGAPLPAT